MEPASALLLVVLCQGKANGCTRLKLQHQVPCHGVLCMVMSIPASTVVGSCKGVRWCGGNGLGVEYCQGGWGKN